MILPELSITTPTPLVLSFRLTALPALVMLPGAKIVSVSAPPRVCAAVVGVSICTFLNGCGVGASADQQRDAECQALGGEGHVRRPFCYKRAVLYSGGFLQNDVCAPPCICIILHSKTANRDLSAF